ncbi:MAG: toll/interleukin-1 receptor domain-containing protein [Deltaproteobacteria bacterium]|jgi:hypothetical protein|nr:toll/interleukin-1 receptor domain-containing protein [Deltaproteobacteria bacterium]
MEKTLKCFISAPAGKETNTLRRILDHQGVQSFDAFDFEVGDSISATIKSKIRESDFAVVVISESNVNVFYELGICEGLGKPIFLVAEDRYITPPFVHNYIYLRASLDNESLISLSLEKFIAQLRKNKSVLRGRKKKTPEKTHSSEISYYLASIGNLRLHGDAAELEELVQKIFRGLSISVEAVADKTRDVGVDFAIWTERLSSTIGNLVLVEFKYGDLTETRIRSAEQQLQSYLVKSEAKAGILLYLDRKGKRFKEDYTFSPLILRYDLEDFIRQVEKSSFEDAILSKRNKMVHGVK